MAKRRKRQIISPLIVVACLTLICQLPCASEINTDLFDQYLRSYFDWAMFIGGPVTNQFLNYPGSQLSPLTWVPVNFNSFPLGKVGNNTPATLYEEFWYHQDVPVGLRRQKQVEIEEDQSGAIVVGAVDDNSVGAVTNVLVRLLVELEVKEATINVVMVPREKFYQIAEALGRYSFFARFAPAKGQQLSIHLRSYPWGQDEYLFHR
jgi:hypothetical protein